MLRIDRIMKDKGITAQELGKMLNVSTQYVSEVSNERKNITIRRIAKFAEVLGVPIAALFDGYHEVFPTPQSLTVKCPKCGHIFTPEF